MPHEVIMPALGMAQDTGLLVAWHKNVGDAVSAGDILMEVETDKSTMEVEAGASGFVTELRAAAGADVPVGQVVAVISETLGVPARPAQPAQPEPAPESPQAEARALAARPVAQSLKPAVEQAHGNSRILASPKARMLAAEQGLDLSRLVAAGVPQPYRVADIAVLRALPAEERTVAPATGSIAASYISARISATGFTSFCAWLDGIEAEIEARSAVWAAFAAAALRNGSGADYIVIRVQRPALGVVNDYADADKCRFSALRSCAAESASLILQDLTGSRITLVRQGAQDCPTLSIVKNGDFYELTLAFSESRLPMDAAFAFLDGFAGRLEEPLRHLL